MLKTPLESVLKKEMTRKDFLGFTALAFISLFGVIGVITELLSHAAAPYTAEEAENGQLSGDAILMANSVASGGKAVQFGAVATTLPTTGALANRIIFGAAGGTAASEIASLGVHIGAFNTYASTMGSGGSSNFPTPDASYALANDCELHISWDQINTSTTFAEILSGDNDASIDAFFQACKNHGKRILLRMWWEMNLSNGLTSPGSNSAMYPSGTTLVGRCATWIEAWQYLYQRCKITNEATNVLFWYCPNGSDGGSSCSTMEQTWPGIDYVDVTGVDTYNNPAWGAWDSFPDNGAFAGSNNMWERLLALAPNLPMGIGETGCVQDVSSTETQDDWLTSMFSCTTLPNLHWLDYFNNNAGGANWAITTTASLDVVQKYVPDTLPAWTAIP
jgi:hypothetical protein